MPSNGDVNSLDVFKTSEVKPVANSQAIVKPYDGPLAQATANLFRSILTGGYRNIFLKRKQCFPLVVDVVYALTIAKHRRHCEQNLISELNLTLLTS